jgi:exodeoxyribonuclease VII large subunit
MILLRQDFFCADLCLAYGALICVMAHLTLYQFNQQIKQSLQEQIAPQQWIIAEISELRLNQKGHCYMELVEKEGNFIQAKMRANIWAYQYKSISSSFLMATGSNLAPGLKVLLNVSVNFHEVYGLSLTVSDIDPNFTLGERSKQRELTLKKLSESGALEKNGSLSLPKVPQRIAVVSSATAAGYQDFVDQLEANPRQVDFSISLFNALMQGDEAPASIMSAFDQIEVKGGFDLIVLIRGGGAQTDLDCFDNESLSVRISELKLPLITGIGHQRDQTIADLAAHTSLKTPTAVAEFLIEGVYQMDDFLHNALQNLNRSLKNVVQTNVNQLERFALRLNSEVNHQMGKADDELEHLSTKLNNRAKQRLNTVSHQLISFENSIYLNNPETIMKKGYTITLKNGRSIHKQDVNSGDEITTLGDGIRVKSKVINE